MKNKDYNIYSTGNTTAVKINPISKHQFKSNKLKDDNLFYKSKIILVSRGIKEFKKINNMECFSTYIELLSNYIDNKEPLTIENKTKFNYLLYISTFKAQMKNIFFYYKNNNDELFNTLSKIINTKDYQILNNLLNGGLDYEHKINKIYQLVISHALKKQNKSIYKTNLLKSFDFNGVFFKKNHSYFNSTELSVFQSVRCKEVQSPISILKKECFDLLNIEDIDAILLDKLFSDIYRDNIKTPYINKLGDKKDIVQYYYKTINNPKELLKFIDDFNNGKLLYSKEELIESSLNKYVKNEFNYYLKKNNNLLDINKNSDLYSLFGQFGCVLCKSYSDNSSIVKKILIKSEINSEMFFSIVKTYTIDNIHKLKIVINILYKCK